MTTTSAGRRRPALSAHSASERASALKERIYATFTGLAIVAVITSDLVDTEPVQAFLTLAVGIVGIASAGFVAEVIAHQVTHAAAPTTADLRTMARISAGALASASVPLLALGAACLGWLTLETATLIATVIYVATLAAVAVLAVVRTPLPTARRLWALLVMLAFIAVVVLVLFVSKIH